MLGDVMPMQGSDLVKPCLCHWYTGAQELEVSEFVLSNELVSMALAMVAENPEVNDILSELFTPDGNELYVHPASRYLRCAPVQLRKLCTAPEASRALTCQA